MAQVVSRRPLTAEARVRSRVNSCGICGGQSGTGTGFSPSSSVSPVNVSFHRCSPNSYHLGNANVSRHPRLDTRPTPSSGGKNKAQYASLLILDIGRIY
jgi:hypothetical protein